MQSYGLVLTAYIITSHLHNGEIEIKRILVYIEGNKMSSTWKMPEKANMVI
jgi:hypothetical protein